MEPRTQDVPGYYVWEQPGKPVAVHLHLDVVDRMSAEVMRGFGAVPKRGAEVGGVLIGTIEPGDPSIVRVEDFEPVQCEYRRGPSYLLTDEDSAAFDAACLRWEPDSSRPAYAVGYFRSHTRDGLSLAPEDIELLDFHFPSPLHIALLIKPFATKPGVAGFFFREDGLFPGASPLEFPFRHRELTGVEAPPRRSLFERESPAERSHRRGGRALAPAAFPVEENDPEAASEAGEIEEPSMQRGQSYAVTAPAKSRMRNWVWIPLSFVFLLLGVLLGFQAALTMAPKVAGARSQEYSLSLSVTKSDDNLSVKWDRNAPVVRAASHGVLEIEDSGHIKPVELDAATLQSGAILLQNPAGTVRFRLTVYPNARLSVTDSVEWKKN